MELLKLAVGTNPGCGQTWYFLGRCHAEQGQFKEAFLAYRQSVSKNDDQPDTWCAIGSVLCLTFLFTLLFLSFVDLQHFVPADGTGQGQSTGLHTFHTQ